MEYEPIEARKNSFVHFIDMILRLFEAISAFLIFVGLSIFLVRGPHPSRIDVGIPLILGGSIGLGIIIFSRSLLKFGSKFLKDSIEGAIMWLAGISLTASGLRVVLSGTPITQVGAIGQGIVIVDLIVGIIMLYFGLYAMDATKERQIRGLTRESLSDKEKILMLYVIIVLAGLIIPTLDIGSNFVNYMGLFLIIGGSIAMAITVILWAYLKGGIWFIQKHAIGKVLVLLVGISIIVVVLFWVPTFVDLKGAATLLVSAFGLLLIIVGNIIIWWNPGELIESYLFSWDDVPGNDYRRFELFLEYRFGIEAKKIKKFEKIDDGRTIKVAFEKKYLYLRLNDEKTQVYLKIDDVRNSELSVKLENDKLKIYG